MLSLVIACTGLLAAAPEPEPADPRAAYRAEVAAAGRDADAQVKLALWCEAHGMQAERFKHLAIALLADPGNAAARGLLGLVADAGKWRKPEAVAARVLADADLSAALAEYNVRRAKTPNTAEAQWKLALRCEERGLKAEASAHLAAVVRLDPKREAAWRRLGYTKQKDGRWATAEQVAAARAEAEAQRKADLHWKPLLEKWRGQLADKGKRGEVEGMLAGVTDPRAVPSLMKSFGVGNAAEQATAVQILGQVDAPSASRALAMLAVYGKSAEVRQRATETLKRRDPREYAGVLIAMIRDKIEYEVRPVGGPGSPGALFVRGKRFNVQRLYSPQAPPALRVGPGDSLSTDGFGLPVVTRTVGSDVEVYTPEQARLWFGISAASLGDQVNPITARNAVAGAKGTGRPVEVERPIQVRIPVGQMMAQAQMSAQVAQQQLQADVDAIRGFNSTAEAANARVIGVLNDATGQGLGPDREAWDAWWIDQLGYSYSAPASRRPNPTLIEDVPLAYQPLPLLPTETLGPVTGIRVTHSCFGAGTMVRTLEGDRTIETLRAGDQILVQDTTTGALNYRPVLVAYHNPPNATLRITLDEESVVATPIHRFWKAGAGWTMARDLKPGDAIRALGGVAKVERIEDDRVQPVFNLEVARGHSFFVGRRGALVHDNSVVLPTLSPFDAPTAVASTR